ncbi:MAG: flagellar basal body rod protein FlgC [Pseudotabrizicola sp.]|uniref:flagellar basal body rod protein FlgC n=1 Tax=Pseudotabrizicola sp. TaxID=2939647 RepID=UPI002725826C|nr:flagellar basal body rod protein FlgC [Pseudotabrizicola sp.]MDO8885258.1 flagellar basal body rod protein FlgC [Pseudotabrizicola sp.]MDP2081145.1 flagellar basal body rod protein FlgC [Pseudotabrizicola sp.]MDZ7575704.1 flagellar basal body rod protein FlgC [Pseudotabrizicola sp.]
MTDLLNSLSLSASGMEAQAKRIRHVSENIANADTPGYRRKVVSFKTEMETGTVSVGKVRLDQTALQKIYDASHPLADSTGHYDGSNVDLVIEIADAREAQRSYEANLRLFDQARQMTQSLFDLIRR